MAEREGRMNAHPAAGLFPMMSPVELKELAADIKQNGLLEAVVRDRGLILDGRNRLLACEIAKVSPRFTEWDGSGGSPTIYVISKNLRRRHLTDSQRGAIGAKLMPMLQGEAKKRQEASRAVPGEKVGCKVPVNSPGPWKGEARQIAAETVQVGEQLVQRAVVVQRSDPAAFERIERGESTVNAEYGRLRKIEAPPPPPPPPAAPPNKRLAEREAAHLRRMIEGLSVIGGICVGIKDLNQQFIRAACPESELKTWISMARGLADDLRAFARGLEGAPHAGKKAEDDSPEDRRP